MLDSNFNEISVRFNDKTGFFVVVEIVENALFCRRLNLPALDNTGSTTTKSTFPKNERIFYMPRITLRTILNICEFSELCGVLEHVQNCMYLEDEFSEQIS